MPGVAVVTGAGRGFGRAIAERLAGRGYAVLATDIDGDAAADTAERIGGFSLRNLVAGPPVLLPVMFTALAFSGGLAVVWGAL